MANELRIVIRNEQRQLLTLVFAVFIFMMTLSAQHLQFQDSKWRRVGRAGDLPATHRRAMTASQFVGTTRLRSLR